MAWTTMTVADRATIANMSPEYGATIGFFPIDDQTLAYLRLTGRNEQTIDLVERYCKEQGLWRQRRSEPRFSQVLELDLSTVAPLRRRAQAPAGPRRSCPMSGGASEARSLSSFKKQPVPLDGQKKLTHGSVVIAAITSCTNTSNPSVMLAAGLLAKKAVERGLNDSRLRQDLSLSPGSRTVTDYYEKAGLTPYLDKLGFQQHRLWLHDLHRQLRPPAREGRQGR